MKIKHLDWTEDSDGDHTTAIYTTWGGWVSCIAFFRGGMWWLNSENKDPSENLLRDFSLDGLKKQAQDMHNTAIMTDFEEDY